MESASSRHSSNPTEGAEDIQEPAGNHFIVCGDDTLALSIVRELTSRYSEDVVVLLPDRRKNQGPAITELPRVVVLERADLTQRAFIDAGVKSARAVALVCGNDIANVHAGQTAEELHPGVRLVMAIYSRRSDVATDGLTDPTDGLTDCVRLSSSAMAAPSFVAAALGEPAPSHLRLAGLTVVVARKDVAPAESVVCTIEVRDDPASPIRLNMAENLTEGSEILVLATIDGISPNRAADYLRPLRGLIGIGRRLARSDAVRRHVIVCGLGEVGTRVVGELHDLGFMVTCVDHDPNAQGVELAHKLGLPVVIGRAELEQTLRAADLDSAISLVATTGSDPANLEMALMARSIRTDLPIVLRLFDDDLAQRAQQALDNVTSRSVLHLAAPTFAAAMLDYTVLRTTSLGRHVLLIADIHVQPGADVVGQTLGDVELDKRAFVLAVGRRGTRQFFWPPASDRSYVIATDDRLITLAPPAGMSRFLAGNTPFRRSL